MKEFKIVQKGKAMPKQKITNSQDAYNIISKFWSDDLGIYESFFILLLDRGNNTIGWAKISQGGIVGTIVDKKIVCKYVVESLASAVILAHNHPAGSLKASKEDIQVTEYLKTCLSFFDCAVFDHIIITPENGYYSMNDNNDF